MKEAASLPGLPEDYASKVSECRLQKLIAVLHGRYSGAEVWPGGQSYGRCKWLSRLSDHGAHGPQRTWVDEEDYAEMPRAGPLRPLLRGEVGIR
jgi:hypothetical protein